MTLLAPTPRDARPVVAAAPATVRYSSNVTRLSLPNSLNSLVQVWLVLGLVLRRQVDVVYVRAASLTFLFGLLLRGWTRVVVVTEHHGQRLADGGAEAARVMVIGNAADTEAIRPLPREPALRRYGPDPARVYLSFLGSLTAWQGLDDVLRAFARLAREDARLHLLLVGEGPCRAALEALASELGLETRVAWLGRVGHEQVGDALACFDLALLPTHRGAYADLGRSPLKLREHAAAGRSVLAAEVDALAAEPWIAFYRPGEAESLCAAALRLRLRLLGDSAHLLGGGPRRARLRRAAFCLAGDRRVHPGRAAARRLIPSIPLQGPCV